MRFSATILIVACCATSLVGCHGGHRRDSCLFGRHHHRHRDACVDQHEWDDDDDGDYHHGHCGCGCDGGGHMPDYGMPMQSMDSGCGCGGSMPSYGGMPMSFPQQSSCGCSGGGMSMPSFPTFDQPVMMGSPTPTPASQTPPPAPGAESYYSPKGLTPMPDQASVAQPAF